MSPIPQSYDYKKYEEADFHRLVAILKTNNWGCLIMADSRPFWIWSSFRAYPYQKPHILFNGNGPAIWHGSPDISHNKVN